MARVAAFVHAPHRRTYLATLRIGIVGGCALALIAAGQALPFITL